MLQHTTIQDFNEEFPDDDYCLDHIFNLRYGKDYICPKCGKTGFYRNRARKCYSCAWCGCDLSPLAGTIFHKSPTSLKTWFYAIFLMSTSKNGVSAKEIQRQTGVTYKTAWRMQRQIRLLMKPGNDPLKGTVEIDDTYVASVVDDLKKRTVKPIILDGIEKDSEVFTDEFLSYRDIKKYDFDHDVVKHHIKEYVRGNVHTNTIEGFWSQLKRSIHGTYHSVSPQHLQLYVDEFAWRYNHRKSPTSLFELLLRKVVEKPV